MRWLKSAPPAKTQGVFAPDKGRIPAARKAVAEKHIISNVSATGGGAEKSGAPVGRTLITEQ